MSSNAAPQQIIYPDAERVFVTYLRDVTSLPVSVDVPNPRPDRFVRVLRTGGPRAGIVTDRAQMTFECWEPTTVAASTTATSVRALLVALQGRWVELGAIYLDIYEQSYDRVWVGRVTEMTGPQNLPDPVSGSARYTWSVMADLRGIPLT